MGMPRRSRTRPSVFRPLLGVALLALATGATRAALALEDDRGQTLAREAPARRIVSRYRATNSSRADQSSMTVVYSK